MHFLFSVRSFEGGGSRLVICVLTRLVREVALADSLPPHFFVPPRQAALISVLRSLPSPFFWTERLPPQFFCFDRF